MKLTTEDLISAVQAKRQVEADPDRPAASSECWEAVGKLLGVSAPTARSRCIKCGEGVFKPVPGRPAEKPGKAWRSGKGLFRSKK